jgi:hypothetical protein
VSVLSKTLYAGLTAPFAFPELEIALTEKVCEPGSEDEIAFAKSNQLAEPEATA